MAAERRGRDRRPAIWPWLLMPLIVLLVFYALLRMTHRPGTPWIGTWLHHHPASDPGVPPTQ